MLSIEFIYLFLLIFSCIEKFLGNKLRLVFLHQTNDWTFADRSFELTYEDGKQTMELLGHTKNQMESQKNSLVNI